MLNLGYMNGWTVEQWDKYHNIKTKCKEEGHKLEVESDNVRCVTTTTCNECGYTYKVDSSG